MPDRAATGEAARTVPVVAVVGPTASGKTALAVQLARRLGGEVVNADAMQFYRGMDIGTAKATEADRGGVTHHLLDTLEITDEASVARFQAEARRAFAEIRSRRRTPVLAGGSGLYVRAALDVLEFPPTEAAVRAGLEERARREGLEVLRAELAAVDPGSAQRLEDARRVIRALEVHQITGRPFSSYMPRREYAPRVDPVVQIGLEVPRDVLHERIRRRAEQMMSGGLLTEVRSLAGRGLREGRTASRAIGYAQALGVLDGELTEDQAVEQIATATRRFARRQETWFRADPRVRWLRFDAPDLIERATAAVRADDDGGPGSTQTGSSQTGSSQTGST